MKRGAGILLHITSLNDELGYGCFSKEAYSFVDFLHACNLKYWQILPLNPVDEYGSPYRNSSMYAIEPSLISLEEYFTLDELVKKGLAKDLDDCEYRRVKFDILRELFAKNEKSKEQISFEKKNKFWLDNYASYMTLEKVFGTGYVNFPKEYKNKSSKAVKKLLQEEVREIDFYKYIQFLAYSQWQKIKAYANKNGISIIGDMPFYLSTDSDVVWANPEIYQIEDGEIKFISGVPGDYFNPDGQIWNNPVYNVKEIKRQEYLPLIKKFEYLSKIYDYVRIDHFRGFESFFKIPASKPYARYGKWEKSVGIEFFKKLKERNINNFILEDLGQIDDKVLSLKAKTGYPCMKVFQFAFDGNPKNPFLPAYYEKNSVAYLGTHDNDTFCGFISNEMEKVGLQVLKCLNLYKNATDKQICYSAIECLLASNSDVVILLPQDILCQGSKHRINKPGTTKNNWKYNLPKKFFSKQIRDYLANATRLHNR